MKNVSTRPGSIAEVGPRFREVCFTLDSVAKLFLARRSQIFRAVGAAIEY
jgi:hypothetical protein